MFDGLLFSECAGLAEIREESVPHLAKRC